MNCEECGCTNCCCGNPLGVSVMSDGSDFVPWEGKTMDEVKREHLLSTLIFFKGNRTSTAKALSISIRTVRNMITVMKGEYPEMYEQIPPPWANETVHQGKWRGYAQE